MVERSVFWINNLFQGARDVQKLVLQRPTEKDLYVQKMVLHMNQLVIYVKQCVKMVILLREHIKDRVEVSLDVISL